MKRDWIPELQAADIKLLVIGIGSADSANQYATQVGLQGDTVFGDNEAQTYKLLNFVNSNFDEDGRKRGMRMISEKTVESIKGRSNGRPVSFFGLFDIPFLATNDDLEAAKDIYKPLTPQGDDALDKTMVQGGVVAFQGTTQVFKHRDTSVGVHAQLEKVLAALK